MSEYNIKNYTEQGGEVTHIGGKLVFEEGSSVEGLPLSFTTAEKQAASTAKNNADLKDDFNALLAKLKDAGLMAADDFTMSYAAVNDSVDSHEDRSYNTTKITGVAIDNDSHVITITLADKVENLRNFDGENGWGVHKWLGIGLGVGMESLIGLFYNHSALMQEDIDEATACGLNAGYFVRWVAADLVLAGDNTQRSVDHFTLSASGYADTEYTIRIVEPGVDNETQD